jgi:hypothetical protein
MGFKRAAPDHFGPGYLNGVGAFFAQCSGLGRVLVATLRGERAHDLGCHPVGFLAPLSGSARNTP